MSRTPASADTRWLSADEQRAWRSFITGSTMLLERLDRALRERHDLSLAEYEILVRLSESEAHRLRMAELASSVSHSRSRVTHTIARMERAGLVGRTACPTDGRGVVAELTRKGWDTLVSAAPLHVADVRELLVDLADPDDLAAVGRVFETVVQSLSTR